MAAEKSTRSPEFDRKYPNLAAQRAADREEHIRRAMEAGMTRAQAERHADEEIAEGDDE